MIWTQLDERHWETRQHSALVGLQIQEADGWPPVRTIFVWRKDSKPMGIEHFEVMQSAKTAIFGPEYTAMEIYPPETELRDREHIYWLQVIDDPDYKLPWLARQRRSVMVRTEYLTKASRSGNT